VAGGSKLKGLYRLLPCQPPLLAAPLSAVLALRSMLGHVRGSMVEKRGGLEDVLRHWPTSRQLASSAVCMLLLFGIGLQLDLWRTG
jgi:hypothetical protein